jgi:hypothetical protein
MNSELTEYASQYSSIEVPGIFCVRFSPNGSWLAVGDVEGRVTVRFDFLVPLLRNLIYCCLSRCGISQRNEYATCSEVMTIVLNRSTFLPMADL